jgi:hypothetical protein
MSGSTVQPDYLKRNSRQEARETLQSQKKQQAHGNFHSPHGNLKRVADICPLYSTGRGD